ncbi:MAG TPA: decaprenyl-phosphate phosphoribosyltransferase [Melioribacteraceae bacterium]|nr:decaprenyl-phosphate phosphoribosyltransferase [Melioribacteraceae bacterium]
MFSKISPYIRILRLSDWLKNIFVFVPLVFSKHLFHTDYILTVASGFIAFSIASGMVYVFNDIIDADSDRLHPLKKNRPVASGELNKSRAAFLLFVLFIIVLLFTILLNNKFILIIWTYVLINLLYTLYLKKIVIADIFSIASGFLLRVVSGAVIIDVDLSNWLILTTIFLSLFLAVMKRRVEFASIPDPSIQRVVLKDYSLPFIDMIAAVTSTCVVISYAFYSVAERTIKAFGSEEFVFTTLFVIFGIFRYMFIAIKKNKGENVIEAILNDLPMTINLILYIFVSLYIIYS